MGVVWGEVLEAFKDLDHDKIREQPAHAADEWGGRDEGTVTKVSSFQALSYHSFSPLASSDALCLGHARTSRWSPCQ